MNALAMQLYEGLGGDAGSGRSHRGRNSYRSHDGAPQMHQAGGEPDDVGYSHPLGDFLGGIAKMAGSGIAYRALKAVKTEKNTVTDSVKGTFQKYFGQKFYVTFKNELPFFAQRYGFLEGFSTADKYYTVLVGGKEVPLYIAKKGEDGLKEDDLKAMVKDIITNPAALTRNDNALNSKLRNELFNDVCGLTGADMRYMNGDLRGMEDLHQFWRKLAKMDVTNIQQFGPYKDIKINLETENGQNVGVVVREYEKPHGMMTYLPNEAGNFLYDIFDGVLFNTIQRLFGTEVAKQIGIEQQLETHIKMRKDMSAAISGRKPMEHYT